MNQDQMKMLSVKSTIERNVYGLMHLLNGQPIEQFWEEANKSIMLLFISHQIDKQVSVYGTDRNFCVEFTTNGQDTTVDFVFNGKPFLISDPTKTHLSVAFNDDVSDVDLMKLFIL